METNLIPCPGRGLTGVKSRDERAEQHRAMSNVLVLYASFDGHTERIARRMASAIASAGHHVGVLAASDDEVVRALERSDAVLVGGAIHRGRHAPYLERLARRARDALAARPNAFFSVSLSAGGNAKQRAGAERCVAGFVKRTGWRPDAHALIAGALPYSRYNPFVRLMMRLIVSMGHGDTDTSRDHEYTDWAAVDGFATAFARRLATATIAA
jgi:menaquinone-dependent protoporphyrinogen oxidase